MARTKASKFSIPCTANVPEVFFDALARALSSVQLSLYFYKLFFIILFYKFQKVTGLKAWGEASNFSLFLHGERARFSGPRCFS
jgi:hypothetical protein